jgi:hypothetical protein
VQRDVNARTVDAAIDYIISQRANFSTSRSAGWTCMVTGGSADFERRVAEAVESGLAAAKLGGNRKNAKASTGWCFCHGPKHRGVDCEFMKRHADFFTAEFFAATKPCTIKGVESFPARVNLP